MTSQALTQLIQSESTRSIGSNKTAAVVVDNNDPKKLQRVRVAIPGLLEAEDKESLPWFMKMVQVDGGVGDSYGSIAVPAIGSRVLVHLQQNDVHYGVYECDLITSRMKLPDELLKNYPNRLGSVNTKGDITYTDLSTGEFAYIHHSGTTIKIADDGTLTFLCKKDFSQIVEGNYVLNVKGTSTTEVKGDVANTFKANVTTNVTGKQTNTIGGDQVNKVSGAITTQASRHNHLAPLTASGEVTAKGIGLSTHKHPYGKPTTGTPLP